MQWHYTDRTGQQQGPVSFEELRELVSSKSIPSTSMVWNATMPAWKPVCQVPEFSPSTLAQSLASTQSPTAQQPSPPSRRAAKPDKTPKKDSVNPYESTSPAQTPTAKAPDIPLSYEEVYSRPPTYDGVGRLSYLIIRPILYLLFLVAAFFVARFTGIEAIYYGAPILFIFFSIRLIALRFINIGMSGWWTLGLLVPLLNLPLYFILNILPPGYAYSKKLDVAAYILGFLFLLPIIALIILIAIGSFSSLVEQLTEQLKHLPLN